MRMYLILAIPMAVAWMPLTANFSAASFGVGYLFSFAILRLLFPGTAATGWTWGRLPGRALAASLYMLILFRDITLSAIDVAKRVVDPRLPLVPGILAVQTQIDGEQEHPADMMAAISAHGITITPGELVVDFDGNQTMYVHCLDVTVSAQVAETNQSRRLALLRRILE